MSDTHEVISAFLDDEPFDPQELAYALGDPSGRALLIDLLALRRIVQPDEAIPSGLSANGRSRRQSSPLRALMAAAAVLVALVGGYFVGQSRSAVMSEAPTPTRVVQAPANWAALPPPSIRSAQ
jgi:hypothetical protein